MRQQSPVPPRQENQVQATGDKDADEEVVPEEALTNDMVDDADASTAQHTHHQSGASREKSKI